MHVDLVTRYIETDQEHTVVIVRSIYGCWKHSIGAIDKWRKLVYISERMYYTYTTFSLYEPNNKRNLSHTHTQIRFNQDGDAYGYYNIYQYQRHGKKYDYIQIGTWKEA